MDIKAQCTTYKHQNGGNIHKGRQLKRTQILGHCFVLPKVQHPNVQSITNFNKNFIVQNLIQQYSN